jgi:hypothetical protein
MIEGLGCLAGALHEFKGNPFYVRERFIARFGTTSSGKAIFFPIAVDKVQAFLERIIIQMDGFDLFEIYCLAEFLSLKEHRLSGDQSEERLILFQKIAQATKKNLEDRNLLADSLKKVGVVTAIDISNYGETVALKIFRRG